MTTKLMQPVGPRSGGLAFSVAAGACVLIRLLTLVILSAAGVKNADLNLYLGYLISPQAVAITLILAVTVACQPVKYLLPVRTRPKYIFMGLMLIFGLLFSLNWLNEYFVRFLELMGYTRRGVNMPDVSGAKIIPALIFMAIIPAVLEEILFRGLILNNIEDGVGSIRAVLLVGFCFALYHGSAEQTIYQFVCGCLFALLAIRSRSITPSVVIHFLNNATIVVLYACGLINHTTGMLELPYVANVIVMSLSAASLVGAVLWLIFDKTLLRRYRGWGVRQFFIGAASGIIILGINWITGLFGI